MTDRNLAVSTGFVLGKLVMLVSLARLWRFIQVLGIDACDENNVTN